MHKTHFYSVIVFGLGVCVIRTIKHVDFLRSLFSLPQTVNNSNICICSGTSTLFEYINDLFNKFLLILNCYVKVLPHMLYEK